MPPVVAWSRLPKGVIGWNKPPVAAWNGIMGVNIGRFGNRSEYEKGKRVSPVRVYVRLWEPIATFKPHQGN
jgi:hypothetical protein